MERLKKEDTVKRRKKYGGTTTRKRKKIKGWGANNKESMQVRKKDK